MGAGGKAQFSPLLHPTLKNLGKKLISMTLIENEAPVKHSLKIRGTRNSRKD